MPARTESDTSPVILLVHGLGLKKSREHEFSKWKDALESGLANVAGYAGCRMQMAYYSDELHPEVRTRRSGTGHRRTALPPRTDGRAAQVTAVEERAAEALADLFLRYQATRAREQQAADGTPPAQAGGRVPGRRRGVTPLPPVTLAADEDYRTFVRDVMKYFGLGHREPVNMTLTDVLDAVPDGTPILLISHSLGTVVSFDVLTAGTYRIDTWITLGSPLGWVQDLQAKLPDWLTEMKPEHLVRLTGAGAQVEEAAVWVAEQADAARGHIRDFFARLPRPGRRAMYALPRPLFPADKVERWFNIFDPADPVAAPPIVGHATLADIYLDGERERVFDIPIRNTPRDPHSEVGYLTALQTVWLVNDFLLRHGLAPTNQSLVHRGRTRGGRRREP
jgi:hypothetical protein